MYGIAACIPHDAQTSAVLRRSQHCGSSNSGVQQRRHFWKLPVQRSFADPRPDRLHARRAQGHETAGAGRPQALLRIRPGASPQEMEEGVVLKIEDNLKGVIGVERITSTSKENSASIRVEILKDYDINIVLADIKNAVDIISG